jgi:hypothetical protein
MELVEYKIDFKLKLRIVDTRVFIFCRDLSMNFALIFFALQDNLSFESHNYM